MRIKIGTLVGILFIAGIVLTLTYFFVIESFRCGITPVLFANSGWFGVEDCIDVHPMATFAVIIFAIIMLVVVIILCFEISNIEIKIGE